MPNESQSHTLKAPPRTKALEALRDLVHQCAEDGWNGPDSVAVDLGAAVQADIIIRHLPAWCPTPMVLATNDAAPRIHWDTDTGFLEFVVTSDLIFAQWDISDEQGCATLEDNDGREGLPLPVLGILAATFIGQVLVTGVVAPEGPKHDPFRVAMAFRGRKRL